MSFIFNLCIYIYTGCQVFKNLCCQARQTIGRYVSSFVQRQRCQHCHVFEAQSFFGHALSDTFLTLRDAKNRIRLPSRYRHMAIEYASFTDDFAIQEFVRATFDSSATLKRSRTKNFTSSDPHHGKP